MQASGFSEALALGLVFFCQGCSCEPKSSTVDAGPLLVGVEEPEYVPRDSGLPPPEPCAVPVRRLRFPVGDESLAHTNRIWAFDSHVWTYLGGFPGALPPSPPPSMHLFDLDAVQELEIDFVVGDDDRVLGIFQAPMGFEIVVSTGDAERRVVQVDASGQLRGLPDQPLEHSAGPLVRLNDGRYVGLLFRDPEPSPMPATLEIGYASGPLERIELGFETASGLIDVRAVERTIVGIGYDSGSSRMVHFEVDLDSAAVRMGTLVEGVNVAHALNGWRFRLWSDSEAATVGLTYEPVDEPSIGQVVELFWWSLGDDAVTRHLVRLGGDVLPGVLSLGGSMPRQTLVLAQTSGFRTWVTAARIRAPGEVIGGGAPLGVFTGLVDAATWVRSDGTVALAFLSQHELEVVFMCEGAP